LTLSVNASSSSASLAFTPPPRNAGAMSTDARDDDGRLRIQFN